MPVQTPDYYRWLQAQIDILDRLPPGDLDSVNLSILLTEARQKLRRDLIDSLGYDLCREFVRWLIHTDHEGREEYLFNQLLPLYLAQIFKRCIAPSPSLLDEVEKCWREAWSNCAKYHNRRGQEDTLPLAPLWAYAEMAEGLNLEAARRFRRRYDEWQKQKGENVTA